MSGTGPKELDFSALSEAQAELFRLFARQGQHVPLEHLGRADAERFRPLIQAWSELDERSRESTMSSWRAADPEDPVGERFDVEAHLQTLSPRWRAVLEAQVQRERAGVQVGDAHAERFLRKVALQGAPLRAGAPLPDVVARLCRLSAAELESEMVVLGATYVGTAREQVGARAFVRFVSTMSPDERDKIGEPVGEPTDDWVRRVRELLVALEAHDYREKLRRMGIYLVAMRCGHGPNLKGLDGLADVDGTFALMRAYVDSFRRSSRRNLIDEAQSLFAVEGGIDG